MKNALNYLYHIIEAFRQAFFHKNYKSFQQKFSIFWTLIVLIWKSKFHQHKEFYQNIFGYKVKANNPKILYQLYLEIFLGDVYFFESEDDEPKIIDAGANIGLSVLYFKFLYPKANIIAIEPDPIAFGYLEENIKQNVLQGVDLIKACVSDKKGKETLFLSENLINSSLFGEGKGVEVDAICLSDLLKKEQFDLVKMDIEGTEIKVFQDLLNSDLYTRSKQYIMEYHQGKDNKERLPEILRVFEENGFKSEITILNSKELILKINKS